MNLFTNNIHLMFNFYYKVLVNIDFILIIIRHLEHHLKKSQPFESIFFVKYFYLRPVIYIISID